MLHNCLKKYGVIKVTAAISLISILMSDLLVYIFDQVTRLWNIRFTPFMEAAIIPAIIVPPIIHMILQLVVKLDLAEEKLLTLSITDELTGIHNRRYFIDHACHELAKAQRYGELFSVAILDIDDFKNINDTYGHLIGDKVLVQAARICKESIRSPDICARYGGDEFVFLFPATGKEKARICLERISGHISNNPINHDGYMIKTHVSIGLAEFSNKELILDDVLKAADMALYQAKCAGKNKVLCSIKTANKVCA
jgi:diguanylate cyclase (GGDEF)-like protein